MTKSLVAPIAHWRPSLAGLTALFAVLLAVIGAASASAAAKPKAPKLTGLRCLPVAAATCQSAGRVVVGEFVQLRGKRLARKQTVTFRWSKGRTTGKTTKRSGVSGYVVRVPKGTATGTVKVSVKDRRGRRSNAMRMKVTLPGAAVGRNPVPEPFTGAGMWIADLADADGGTTQALIDRARAARISTIFLKSADGTTSQGNQFNSGLVSALKAAGIRVCAWQFVYGAYPEAEAALALGAIGAGADCFVVNAESQYAGRYAQAQRYMAAVRATAGADYPIGFTSFSRPQSHPSVPYSVFLGPGGAQVNMPQVYWGEAKESVADLSKAAATGNRIYGRPLIPLGQTYGGATADEVQAFRSAWKAYGAPDVSWFRWGNETITPSAIWAALGTATPASADAGDPGWQFFKQGDSGDGVRWMQQLLATFDSSVAVDGTFGAGTDAALRRFQLSRNLASTGGTGPQTWSALLTLKAKAVSYTG